MWKIYKITNIINQKSYIGQTCQTVEERWRKHLSDAPKLNTPFSNAIEKYGWDNFTKEVIDTATTKEEADKKEKYWINHYQTCIQEFGKEAGYNITPGGEGVIRITQEEEKQMCDLWSKGYNITQISDKVKRDRHAVSRILKKYISEEEIIQRKFTNVHKIYIFNLKAKLVASYNSLSETLLAYPHIGDSQIRNVLYHKLASTHQLIFLYEEDIDQLQSHITRNQKQHHGGVQSINMLTGEIIQYPTITRAEKDTGICRQTIRNRIRKSIIKNNLKWEDI